MVCIVVMGVISLMWIVFIYFKHKPICLGHQLKRNANKFMGKQKKSGKDKLYNMLVGECTKRSKLGATDYQFVFQGDLDEFMYLKAKCKKDGLKFEPDDYAYFQSVSDKTIRISWNNWL